MPPEDPPPIQGIPTAVTAFIGRTVSGPVESPTPITSFAEFRSLFGELSAECPLTTAVVQFFANGGTDAVIVRLDNGGQSLTASNFIDPALESQQRGIWTLGRTPHVNLIVIPPLAPGMDVPVPVWNAAIALAAARRAFVLVDPPKAWATAQNAIAGAEAFVTRSEHAALYFPQMLVSDYLTGQTIVCAPSGLIAGIYGRTDRGRGVWKAPANEVLRDVLGPALTITDVEQEPLNGLGVNVIRKFPGRGVRVWGARTMVGVDGQNTEWKYISVRRFVDFVEGSIIEGTKWVEFEPNNGTTWQKLQVEVWTFLKGLWQSGAMQGSTSNEAFFVKCDQSTMTQDDINNGRVIVMIGLAVIRRAEFTVVRIGLRSA